MYFLTRRNTWKKCHFVLRGGVLAMEVVQVTVVCHGVAGKVLASKTQSVTPSSSHH